MSVSNVAVAFRPVSELDCFERLKLPTLTDDQHLARAKESGAPHSYIAERAGLLAHDEGFRGLGLFNAIEMHKKVILDQKIVPETQDVVTALSSISFCAALKDMGSKIPAAYRALIGVQKLQSFIEPKENGFHL